MVTQVTDNVTWISDQILVATKIWAVYHNGEPINYRRTNMLVDIPGPRYKRTIFNNRSSATRLCRKLNRLFVTDKFKVMELGPI